MSRFAPAFPRELVYFAFDRGSVRSFDADGRVHISTANICQARTDEYMGDEIPDYEKLGLDPNRKYRLFRPPEELSSPRTIKSANLLPILDRHVPVSAGTHKFANTIGSTGSHARWEAPFITNALVFWPQRAIDDIESGARRALSPAYRYKAVMRPGTYGGERADGYMTDIEFNHLASVETGRQGASVVVGDSAHRLATRGALKMARKYGRDQEEGEGSLEELREMLDEGDIPAMIAQLIENAPEHQQEELGAALREMSEDRRGYRGWAKDRLMRARDARRYSRDRRRYGRDEPEPFKDMPRPGTEGEDRRRRMGAAAMPYDSSPHAEFARMFGEQAAKIERG